MIEELKALETAVERFESGLDAALIDHRNAVLEEVAQHIEKLTGFGQDTINSFATYIRKMKK